jgi:hypothetical protein
MGSFGVIKNGKKQIITGGSGGGGHVIQNTSGTDLTQRDTLQFGGYLQTTDDSTNEKTVVSDEPIEVTWSAWQQMTDSQKDGTKWLITDVPSADGSISADLMTKLWENPSPGSIFVAQNIDLSSSDYDYLMFYYSAYGNYGYETSLIINKGQNIALFYASPSPTGNVCASRNLSRSTDTRYVSDDAYYGRAGGANQGVDNLYCIPTSVYGIKKTVTVNFDAIASDVSTSASKCMLSDGVTSVEDAIDELNADITTVEDETLTKNGDTIRFYLKNGVCSFYGSLAHLSSSDTVVAFGILPAKFKPRSIYAIFNPFSQKSPYSSLANASLWIDNNTGNVVIYKSSETTGCYVYGEYMVI